MTRLFAKPPQAEMSKNPYLNAKRLWNEHGQGLLHATRMWQAVALISMMITLAAVGGAVYVAGQSKFVPYIIEVDKLGQNVAVAPAQKAAQVDQRVVHASLAAFMSNARLVTPDIAVQRKAIFSLYAMLHQDDPAAAKMTAWLNGNEASNPFHRAAKQIEWNEKTFDRQGSPIGQPYRMRALATVAIIPPDDTTSEDKIRQNPLGVYVKDFSWSKQN